MSSCPILVLHICGSTCLAIVPNMNLGCNLFSETRSCAALRAADLGSSAMIHFGREHLDVSHHLGLRLRRSAQIGSNWPSWDNLRKCSFFIHTLFRHWQGVSTDLLDTAWESTHFSLHTLFRHWQGVLTSWLPYSTYLCLDFHLLCSMTKVK